MKKLNKIKKSKQIARSQDLTHARTYTRRLIFLSSSNFRELFFLTKIIPIALFIIKIKVKNKSKR